MYLIWSFEHAAWWGPHRTGYTTVVEEAGRYSLDDALDIVCTANQFARTVHEALVPETPHAPWCRGAVPPTPTRDLW